MSFEVQTIEFEVKAVITWEASAPPTVYYYEVGAVDVEIVIVSAEFVQL